MMKKRLPSLLFTLALLFLLLSVLSKAAGAGESFDSFCLRMRQTYSTNILCERETPLTGEDQAEIEQALAFFGSKVMKTKALAYGNGKPQMLDFHIKGPHPEGRSGDATLRRVNIYSKVEASLIVHELTHALHQTWERISNDCVCADTDRDIAACNDGIAYGTTWDDARDGQYFALDYGKLSAHEDMATLMACLYQFPDTVAQHPAMLKKLQVMKEYMEQYLCPMPVLDELFGARESPVTQGQNFFLTCEQITLRPGQTGQIQVGEVFPTTATSAVLFQMRECDRQLLKLREDGSFKALRPGTALVTGFLEGTTLGRVCTITIMDDDSPRKSPSLIRPFQYKQHANCQPIPTSKKGGWSYPAAPPLI